MFGNFHNVLDRISWLYLGQKGEREREKKKKKKKKKKEERRGEATATTVVVVRTAMGRTAIGGLGIRPSIPQPCRKRSVHTPKRVPPVLIDDAVERGGNKRTTEEEGSCEEVWKGQDEGEKEKEKEKGGEREREPKVVVFGRRGSHMNVEVKHFREKDMKREEDREREENNLALEVKQLREENRSLMKRENSRLRDELGRLREENSKLRQENGTMLKDEICRLRGLVKELESSRNGSKRKSLPESEGKCHLCAYLYPILALSNEQVS